MNIAVKEYLMNLEKMQRIIILSMLLFVNYDDNMTARQHWPNSVTLCHCKITALTHSKPMQCQCVCLFVYENGT